MRSFAKYLGFSPAQLSQMMSGKRSITIKAASKISNRLGFSPFEKKKFMSSLINDKSDIKIESTLKFKKMSEDQFSLIADWYHLAILSLTKVKNAKADPRWVARRLGISVEQAHQALLRLERMGLILIKPQFKQVGDPFEAVSEVPSEAIRKYHKQNLNLAIEKIETVSVNLREFQSISMALNPNLINVLKKHIDEFLEKMNEEISLSKMDLPTEVYNLNVQLYPVSITKE